MIIEALLGRWQVLESMDFPPDEINALAPAYLYLNRVWIPDLTVILPGPQPPKYPPPQYILSK